MAPEYLTNGQFSVKSDVFSFGMLVLEVITGQKNNKAAESENLITYVSDDIYARYSMLFSLTY